MRTIQQRKEECSRWTDERLTAELGAAAADERRALVGLLLHLAEFDKRRLSEESAYSSLFDYCTRKLGYSSSEAGRRIAVARKGDIYPVLLEMIERKELHLSGAGMAGGLGARRRPLRLRRRGRRALRFEGVARVRPRTPLRARRDLQRPSNIRLLCRAHNQLRAREPSAPGP